MINKLFIYLSLVMVNTIEEMSDFKLLNKFCETKQSRYLQFDRLYDTILKYYSKYCLDNKIGNISLATIILNNMDSEIISKRRFLRTNSYVLLDILNKNELKDVRTSLLKDISEFPEYNQTKNNIYVMGAFGALGNPASFHNPTVRKLRLKCMETAKYILTGKKLEQLIDRISIRRKGTTMSKETWHQDITELKNKEDRVYGGWINLNSKDSQFFSCIPGTHDEKFGEKGFAKLSKNDMTKFTSKSQKIEIKPGQLIIFYQTIIHEVLAGKSKIDSLRLYMGWRVTDDDKPLFKLSKLLKEQGIINLPSGQKPPMYAKFDMVFRQPGVLEWSKNTFKKECLIKFKDTQIVPRFMESLEYYKLKKYPEYTQEELDILTPKYY